MILKTQFNKKNLHVAALVTVASLVNTITRQQRLITAKKKKQQKRTMVEPYPLSSFTM